MSLCTRFSRKIGVFTLEEFLYNNSYQANIRMAPFEALYSKRCRTPLCWNDLEDTLILGPKIAQEIVDKIKAMQRNIKPAQDSQKAYADRSQRLSKFEEGIKCF